MFIPLVIINISMFEIVQEYIPMKNYVNDANNKEFLLPILSIVKAPTNDPIKNPKNSIVPKSPD